MRPLPPNLIVPSAEVLPGLFFFFPPQILPVVSGPCTKPSSPPSGLFCLPLCRETHLLLNTQGTWRSKWFACCIVLLSKAALTLCAQGKVFLWVLQRGLRTSAGSGCFEPGASGLHCLPASLAGSSLNDHLQVVPEDLLCLEQGV